MEIPEEIRNLKFEEARARLEELVEKMESGNMPLEELISAYEKGSQLTAHCRALLEGLQRRVEIIVNGGDPQPKRPAVPSMLPEPTRATGAARRSEKRRPARAMRKNPRAGFFLSRCRKVQSSPRRSFRNSSFETPRP